MIGRIVFLLLVLSFQGPLEAQTPGASPLPDNAIATHQPSEYLVGPGDMLAIQVFGLAQLNRATRVSNSGKMSVPYLGVLPAAGMAVSEIETDIARKLKDRKLLNDPWVRVQVTEFNAQPVFVIGEVNRPGQFMMTGEMRLVDAFTKAGGLKSNASEEAILIRHRPVANSASKISEQNVAGRKSAGGKAQESGLGMLAQEDNELIKIDIAALSNGSRPELNIRLQGGDTVYVPTMPQRIIYIIGEVRNPGAYILPPSYGHITATTAVAYAGGARRETSRTKKAFVVRRNEDGTYKTMTFNLVKSVKGEQPDIPMQPDDILFVPRSITKMVGYRLFDMIGHMTHQMIIF